MRASENALLKQLVLSTNIKTAWAATWFVLFLNWFQGIFPGENVFWVVPQLQDSPAQTWRHAAHKFVPGTLGLELSVDSYFQSGYFQMLPQHVLHPWVPSQWLWPLNLLQCPSPQELFFFVTDLFSTAGKQPSRLLTSPSDSCSSVTCWSFFCPFLYKIYSISDWFPRKPSLKNRNRLGGKQNTPKIPLCNVQ